jgi:hypothetical protein
MVGAGGDGSAFTTTFVDADAALHPFASVMRTEYEPDAVTVIDCVVAPVDQR